MTAGAGPEPVPAPGPLLVPQPQTVLVISAHAADFVWRCGGYLAGTVARGGRAEVVCLSFGERGESPGAWRQEGMTIDRVKQIRRAEATAAAGALGAQVRFLDKGDYPLPEDRDTLLELAGLMREIRPSVILTHAQADPYNDDHPVAARLALRARIIAQARGHLDGQEPLGAPQAFRFEPHQPEMCEFRPDVLIDITAVYEQKLAAMRAMGSQDHLVSYYAELARRRGVQAVRNGGPAAIRYAEAYQRVFPQVTDVLS
jgi:4-oxalomesaconate hydratase